MGAPFEPPRRFPGKRVVFLSVSLLGAFLFLAVALVLQAWPRPMPEVRPDVLPAASGSPAVTPAVSAPPDNTSPAHVYFAPAQSDANDSIDKVFLSLLRSAKTSIECAFYELELESAADALVERHGAGILIGIVSDSDYQDRPAIVKCINAGIPVVFDGRSAFMHDKFCVVDGRWVWTGSTNITDNCMNRNNNNALLLESQELAEDYAAEFNEMFSARRFGKDSPKNTPYPVIRLNNGTRIEVFFAPEDGAGDALVKVAGTAAAQIDFAAFSFTSEPLAEVLSERIKAGVRVRGVFEKRGANSTSSRYKLLVEHGADVRMDKNPANMHHKFMVIDGKTVATGSFNFSRNADERNDENLIVLHDPGIARQYLAEMERLLN